MRISEFRCSCSCFAHVDTAVAQSVGSVYRTIINEFLKKNDFIFSLLRDSIRQSLERKPTNFRFIQHIPTFQMLRIRNLTIVLFILIVLLSGTDARRNGSRRRRRSFSPPADPPAECLAHQVHHPRGGACTFCGPGKFPDHTLDKCVTCPVGTVSKGYAVTVCHPCPGSLIPNPQGSGCLSKFHYGLNWYFDLICIGIVLFIVYRLLSHASFNTRVSRFL